MIKVFFIRYDILSKMNRKSLLLHVFLPFLFLLLGHSTIHCVHAVVSQMLDDHISYRTVFVIAGEDTQDLWKTDAHIATAEAVRETGNQSIWQVTLQHIQDVDGFLVSYGNTIEIIPVDCSDVQQQADHQELLWFQQVLGGTLVFAQVIIIVFMTIITIHELDAEKDNDVFLYMIGFSHCQRIILRFAILLRFVLFSITFIVLASVLIAFLHGNIASLLFSLLVDFLPFLVLYPLGAGHKARSSN